MRWLKTASLALGLIATGLLIWQIVAWYKFLTTPMLTGKSALVIELKHGTGMFSLTHELKNRGLLKHPKYFEWLAKFSGTGHNLQAGEYKVLPGTTPLVLLNLLCSGKVIQHQITLIEGWKFQQVLDALNNEPAIEQTLTHLSHESIRQRLQIPQQSIEGLLFPDTYNFTKGTTDTAFLQRAYELMQKYLTIEWANRQAGLPYQTPYQALIAASLIEKEAKLTTERSLISGVIVKRLRANMLLQIDAAVIYGLGEAYRGKLYKSDMRKDTPYNTYLHKGLPPTPIAMPSLASLHAALHPTITDNVFYVARGDGSHYFSSNLAAHQYATQQFLVKKTTIPFIKQTTGYSHNLFNINSILLRICVNPSRA